MNENIQKPESCSTGLDQGVSCLLAYLFGWIGGLVFWLVEKDNRFVRFHAMQSILLSVGLVAAFIVLFVLSLIPFLGLLFWLVNILLMLGGLALFVVLIVTSYQGRKIVLPVVGPLAEKLSENRPAA